LLSLKPIKVQLGFCLAKELTGSLYLLLQLTKFFSRQREPYFEEYKYMYKADIEKKQTLFTPR